jgi:DNA-binding SARP family transcriptional activator
VRLYAGPFLDGFFLRDAPEFDRWVEDQRRRLQRRCSEAIIRLARGASATGDHVHALAWWRRAVELDPFDTETVRHLVQASLIVGDRASALRHVHQHADLLRTELGLDPDPNLVRLMDQVRSASG